MNIKPRKNARESLWAYSERVYAQPDVKRVLLELQDVYQLNIDIALWCCWLQDNSIFLAKETLDDVLVAIDSVNQAVLRQLREARHYLRNSGSFSRVQERVISKQVLSAELMIEKVLIYRLQDLTSRFHEVMQDREDPLSLEHYLEFMMIPDARQVAEMLLNASQIQVAIDNSSQGLVSDA